MYTATPVNFVKPEVNRGPIALMYCPECGTVNEFNDEGADPKARCPGCGTDSPAYSYERVYPALSDLEAVELQRVEKIALGRVSDV